MDIDPQSRAGSLRVTTTTTEDTTMHPFLHPDTTVASMEVIMAAVLEVVDITAGKGIAYN